MSCSDRVALAVLRQPAPISRLWQYALTERSVAFGLGCADYYAVTLGAIAVTTPYRASQLVNHFSWIALPLLLSPFA